MSKPLLHLAQQPKIHDGYIMQKAENGEVAAVLLPESRAWPRGRFSRDNGLPHASATGPPRHDRREAYAGIANRVMNYRALVGADRHRTAERNAAADMPIHSYGAGDL